MAQAKLVFYVDIISPFAYMAFHVIRHNPTFKGLNIEYVPVFLGGIMQEAGNKPPLSVPLKGAYLMRSRERWVKRFNIPIGDGTPEPFPQPTIQTLRALCAIQQKYPSKLVDAIDVLYKTLWIDHKLVGKPEVISTVLGDLLSRDELDDVMKMSQEADMKKRLLDNTKSALEQGCFGLPYFVATNSKGDSATFWGFDHLGEVTDHLGLQKQGEGFRAML